MNIFKNSAPVGWLCYACFVFFVDFCSSAPDFSAIFTAWTDFHRRVFEDTPIAASFGQKVSPKMKKINNTAIDFLLKIVVALL
jgi:hypothetical protein